MKSMRVLSLRLWLPTLILISFVTLWLTTVWSTKLNVEAQLLQSSMEFVTYDLSVLQRSVNHDINENHVKDAWQRLSQRSNIPQYITLAVVSDQDKILHANRQNLTDLRAEEALPNFDPTRFTQTRKMNLADIVLDSEQYRITAYIPVSLGTIVAVYDFSAEQEQIWSQVLRSSLPFGLILLLTTIFIALFLRRFITQPIQHLVEKTQVMGRGGRDALSKISGKGELAKLSNAFNEVSRQLESRFQKLEKAERSLRESESSLNTLVNSTSAILWQGDPQTFQFTFVSQEAETLLGYPVKRWINEPEFWEKHIHPDDRDKAVQSCITATEECRDHEFDYRMIATDGREIWLHDVVTVISEGGRPVKLVGIMLDITERKQAEKKIFRFNHILQNSQIEIYIFDSRTFLFIDANQGAIKNTGYSLKELRSMTPLDIKPEFTKESFLKLSNPLKTGIKRKIQFTTTHARKDGSTYPVEVNLELVAEDPPVFMALITDISERLSTLKALANSEKKFRALYDNSPDMNVSVSPDDATIILCNQTLLDKTGYTVDEVIGAPVFNLYHEDYLEKAKRAFQKFTETGKVKNAEMLLKCKDGSTIDVSLNVEAVRDNAGKILYSMSSWRDISEHKKTELALRRSQKMEALGQLTGGIAHDFNNLLGIINGNVELISLAAQLDDKSSKRLESISQASERAAKLTRQLLGFSSRKRTSVGATDINLVIKDMDDMIERSLTPQITIEYQLAKDLWATRIDQGDFSDALINLIINARDAMTTGGTLSIETINKTLNKNDCALYPGLTPGNYVCLTINDNGEGIPPDTIEQIFEPFFTTKPQGKGTGLGLSLVFGFTQRSEGHISVYSEPDVGTTFNLYLPRTTDSAQESRPVDQDPTAPYGTETILVVDDEPALLEFAQTALESLGYQVSTASDGRQALEILKAKPDFALLFSDVVMPGALNGYRLAEQATKLKPDLKVLLTSGYTDKAAARNGQALFKTNLLSKPYTLSDLALRVRKTLDETALDRKQHKESHPMTFGWTDDMGIGVVPMDNDHKWLLNAIGHCQHLVESGTVEEYRDLLDELQNYAQTHFTREEALMNAVNYPGMELHRTVHQMYVQQVSKSHKKLDQGKMNGSEMVAFLRDWWVEHIQTMDRAYTFYCQEKEALITKTMQETDAHQESGNKQ